MPPRCLQALALHATLPALFAATVLAACLGSDNDATSEPPVPAPTPTPAPAPSPPPSAGAGHYLIGVSSPTSDGTQDTIHVVDSDNPTPPRLSIDITGVAYLITSQGVAVDSATREETLLGSPMAYFLKQGSLFQVTLSKPADPVSTQVSSLSDVCSFHPVAVRPLDATALTAWVAVRTAGADGSCSTLADNRTALARSDTPAATAATLLPEGVILINAYVSDDQRRLLWMPAIDASAGTPRLVAYKPDLQKIDVAQGGDVSTATQVNVGATLGDGIWLRTDNQLRQLSGDASTLTLAPASHTFTAAPHGDLGLTDAPWLYFTDAERVMRVQDAGPATVFATLPVSGGGGLIFTQTADHLLLRQTATRTISVIGKADGRITTLLADVSPTVPYTPLTASGNTLTYITGVAGGVGELRQQPLDGSAGTVLATGVGYVGPVVRSLFKRDLTQLAGAHDSLWYCRPPSGEVDCRNGALSQLDLPDGRTTELGSFSGGPASATWRAIGQGQDNLSASLLGSFASPTGRDLYVVGTGAAGSLKRVTQNVP